MASKAFFLCSITLVLICFYLISKLRICNGNLLKTDDIIHNNNNFNVRLKQKVASLQNIQENFDNMTFNQFVQRGYDRPIDINNYVNSATCTLEGDPIHDKTGINSFNGINMQLLKAKQLTKDPSAHFSEDGKKILVYDTPDVTQYGCKNCSNGLCVESCSPTGYDRDKNSPADIIDNINSRQVGKGCGYANIDGVREFSMPKTTDPMINRSKPTRPEFSNNPIPSATGQSTGPDIKGFNQPPISKNTGPPIPPQPGLNAPTNGNGIRSNFTNYSGKKGFKSAPLRINKKRPTENFIDFQSRTKNFHDLQNTSPTSVITRKNSDCGSCNNSSNSNNLANNSNAFINGYARVNSNNNNNCLSCGSNNGSNNNSNNGVSISRSEGQPKNNPDLGNNNYSPIQSMDADNGFNHSFANDVDSYPVNRRCAKDNGCQSTSNSNNSDPSNVTNPSDLQVQMDEICKLKNYKYKDVKAVNIPCQDQSCNKYFQTKGYWDICNSGRDDWSCCAKGYDDFATPRPVNM